MRRFLSCVAILTALLPMTGGAALARSGGILNCPIDADCIGSGRAEIINANIDGGGDNILDGRGGKDIINGLGNGDFLVGGRGRDLINGGGGDIIFARDRRQDLVSCIEGDIIASFDNRDLITGICEFDPDEELPTD